MTSSDRQNIFKAEALWNHVTLDPVELAFQAGDVIHVVDMLDKDCWWGRMDEKEGWFPSAFVVLQTSSQCGTDINIDDVIKPDNSSSSNDVILQPTDRVRARIIREMIATERDYVKHLHDVIEGYVSRAKCRSDLFSVQQLTTIFGNIEQLYTFAVSFLSDLEKTVLLNQPHDMQLGNCFIRNQRGFEIYSEYCNNHPHACNELFRLNNDVKYQQFFEACRLLQGMPNIPLDGFLLTPVQKICKYPVQLKELLRHSDVHQADYSQLQAALDATKWTATLINERKRKVDCLEMLLTWQDTITDWQGPAVIEISSELIHAGQLLKVNATGWTRERQVFLFDHQLIYCKKDLLWKDLLSYRGRINIDSCSVLRVRDECGGSVRHGFKVFDHIVSRWYLFLCHTVIDYDRWLRAFDDERRRVTEDRLSGFDVTVYRNKALLSHNRLLRVSQHPRTKEKHSLNKTATDDVTTRLSRSLSLSPHWSTVAVSRGTQPDVTHKKNYTSFNVGHRRHVT